ncbi:MAG: anaerobic ribonucleoside-triphosphate reductase activating protein [bacterium]
MQIAGAQKLSLIDYPGKMAAIIFTYGCNLRCPFCHNPELVIAPFIKTDDDIFNVLKERKGLIEGVCITGGEPLLQDDLGEFMKEIKEMGFLVKLDTNGLLCDKLEMIIKNKLADYIAMDIKAPLRYDEAGNDISYYRAAGVKINTEKIKKSINLIMNSGIDYEFRTTIVSGIHKKNDIIDIAKLINGAKKYNLQKFEIRDKILDTEMLNASSISKKEALELQEECKKYAQECELRGWE